MTLVSGLKTLVAAVQSSAGAGDAGKIVALNSSGFVDLTMLQVGPDTYSIVTSENLASGDFVNIYNNAGTANARKADAAVTTKKAWGFVLSAVTSPAAAVVYLSGINTAVTGLTPGEQFLSDTVPGKCTTTLAAGAGHLHQSVGIASTATTMQFDPGDPVSLG
jgi:hypothetical protein